MTITVTIPDKIIHEVPIAELEWCSGQDIQFDHMPAMETTVTCENYTHRDIWVAERTGAISKISPKSSYNQNKFCIKIQRRRASSTHTEFDIFDVVEDKSGKIKTGSGAAAVDRSYSIANGRGGGMRVCHEVIFTIPLAGLQGHGGSLYHHETDMVLAVNKEQAVHPGSPQSRLKSKYRAMEADLHVYTEDPPDIKEIKKALGLRRGSDMARVMIGIVDNERRYGDKFVNLLGTPHLVRAVKSATLIDGVYVVRDELINTSGRSSKPTVTHYSFEDVETSGIRLFNSSSDALTYGEPEKAAEREAEKLKADNLRLKAELDKQQTESKLAITQVSDQVDRGAIVRKDYYEERSQRRKDSSEDMKYVYAGLAGFLGLVALFLKAK